MSNVVLFFDCFYCSLIPVYCCLVHFGGKFCRSSRDGQSRWNCPALGVQKWEGKWWNGEIGAWKVSHDDSPTVCHKIRLILIRTDTYLTFGMLTYSVQGLCLVQHSHTDCHTALNAHVQHAHAHLQVHAVRKFASVSALNVHFPPVSYLIISDKWQWMVHSPAVLHRPILWLLWARWGEPRCPRVLSH